ncbi:MAG: hypothetical protein IPM18_09935 [Phycisphaerales bacterium]|nr:hypothetical protein [Phycisphaerales bacterium]
MNAPVQEHPPLGTPPAADRAAKRKGPPAWGVLLFLGLLAGFVLLNQWISTGGPELPWFEGTLEQAQEQARQTNKRIFLYLFKPTDPLHQRNELHLFNQRWVREPLETAIRVKIAVQPGDLLSSRFNLGDSPLLLLLNADGEVVTRTDGLVDERQFMTYIGRPLTDFDRQKQQVVP